MTHTTNKNAALDAGQQWTFGPHTILILDSGLVMIFIEEVELRVF